MTPNPAELADLAGRIVRLQRELEVATDPAHRHALSATIAALRAQLADPGPSDPGRTLRPTRKD